MNFNTSYVWVKVRGENLEKLALEYFNTSYVWVKDIKINNS